LTIEIQPVLIGYNYLRDFFCRVRGIAIVSSYPIRHFLTGLGLEEVFSQFATSGTYFQRLTEIFGDRYDPRQAATLQTRWQEGDFSDLPQIVVVDDDGLGAEPGLYSSERNLLYLSRDFLDTATPEQLSTFLLEAIAHRMDEYINTEDAPGDEGKLFAIALQGQQITAAELERIRGEGDNPPGLAATQLPAIVLTVNLTTDQNDGSAANGLSLRDAILLANRDTTRDYEIRLPGGQTYALTIQGTEREDAAFTGDLDMVAGSRIKIVATGTGNATIDASGFLIGGGFGNYAFPDRVFEVLGNAHLTLEKITVRGGSFSGLIVQANGTATLTDSTVWENSLQTAHFSQGVVTPMAGGITNYGTLTLNNSSIANNRTDQIDTFGSGTNGGGLRNYGTATLNNSTVNDNIAGKNYDGGGIYNEGTLTLTNTTLAGNKAGSKGSGLYNSGTATITNSLLRDHSFAEGAIAHNGSGIYNQGNLTISNSQIRDNTAKENAGGIWNAEGGQITLTDTVITNNLAQGGAGGGIVNLGRITGTRVNVDNNSGRTDLSTSSVGGIANESKGTLSLTDSSINGNIGGGLFNGASFDSVGNVTLTNTTVNNNSSRSSASAIFSQGKLVLERVTVQGNTVTDVNSAVAIALDGLEVKVQITNSTIRNNTGIGIQNKALSRTITDSLILTNSTIENNTGHGIENDDYMTVTNSIIQNNGKTGIVNVDGFAQINGFQILYLVDSTVRGNGEGGVSNGINNFLYSLRSTIENHNGTGITNNGIAAIYNNTIRNNTTRGVQTGFSSPLIYRPVFVNWPGIDKEGNTSQTLVFNSSIHDNGTFSTDWGGGINNRGALTLFNSAIYNNRASEGGGIHNAGSFSTEVIEREPDGIDNDRDGTIDNEQNPVQIIYYPARLLAENTTISGNRATGDGGGIKNASIASGTVTNTTITNNTADSDNNGNGSGGGLFNTDNNILNDYRITARNTIIAGNFDTPNNAGAGAIHRDISGSAIGNNRNLIGNLIGASGSIATGDDIIAPNPRLGPLQNNGGVTPTHALLLGSPALNAGNHALAPSDRLDEDGDGNTTEAYAFDGRGTGFNRVFGNAIDIGAFEAQTALTLPTITLAVNPTSVTEDSAENLIFTLTRSHSQINPLTVTYTIAGTASNGTDYATIPTSVTFAANSLTATVTVDPTGDRTVEPDETVILTLNAGADYAIGTTEAVTGTVTNDDTNSAPSDLMFTPNQTTYNPGETLQLTSAWVKDLNGSSDLARVDLWVQKPNGQWIDLTDATTFTPWTGGDEWGSFNYSLGLANYEAGNYTLWGQASDKAGATSNAVTKTFTVLNNSINFAPTDLQFNLDKTSYRVGDTLNLTSAWVKDLNGSNDLSRVDLWLKPASGDWIDLNDATTFTPWSGGAEWGSFNYSLNLSGYRPDNYTLWAQAIDRERGASNVVTKTFSLIGSTPALAPTDLMFTPNKNTYTVGDTLTLTNAWVKDLNGSDDLARIDMWIKPSGGNWIDVSDATTFTPWSGGAEWGSFDYSLSLGSYTPDSYTLWGQASDRSGAVSNVVSRSIEIIAGTNLSGIG
jgi:hypothetical protein